MGKVTGLSKPVEANGSGKPNVPAAITVVLDTNVVISCTLFRSGRLKAIRDAWTGGRIKPVVSTQTAQELVEVVSYPKFKLSHGDIAKVLSLYMPYVQTHVIDSAANRMAHVKPCRDPRDQKFLELAQSAQVEFLVTGDRDLLVMDDPNLTHNTFHIVTPSALLLTLDDKP